jgi:hypothetical protein
MNKIGAVVVREIRQVLPAFVFFLILFHMIALTKSVLLDDYSITALRATFATVGALMFAKAILLVEALPIARLFPGRGMIQVLWKTLLFAGVTLLFRLIEEIIPLIVKHGGVLGTARELLREISWPVFWVLALWIVGSLFLYGVASELVRTMGPENFKDMLFGPQAKAPEQ